MPPQEPGLDGSWMVSITRPDGRRGTALLTFSPDGSLMRSGDLHPLESPGHGAWVRTGEREFDLTYVTLQFDPERNLVGSRSANIRLTLSVGLDEFAGVARVKTMDLEDNLLTTSGEIPLQGKRLQVEPYA
jgi:hypothetical protein